MENTTNQTTAIKWFIVPEIVNTLLNGKGKIVCQERLGGLLKSYKRAA